MPTKISTIFFRAMFIGCREPALRSGPGRVTSMVSAARRAAFSFSASSAARSSSLASSAARTSFTSWPIFGRSSGGSLPMPRSSAVSSPFLPSAATRICSRLAVARASSMFFIARSRSSRSIFSIETLTPQPCDNCLGQNKGSAPARGEAETPLYHPNSPVRKRASHSDNGNDPVPA